MRNKFMRILVLFDLPVKEESERKIYAKFRKYLINEGYDMIQYSVYTRICNGYDSVTKYMSRLEKKVPDKGSIRVIVLTDKQYSSMKIFIGNSTNQEKYLKNEMLSIF